VRTLITGAGGQLGRDLVDAFADHEVVALGHAELDVGDEASVAGVVDQGGFDLVVNAAAWTDVDACEADPDRAHVVNALGPWWLARACRRTGATLVTLSTDQVFDGQPRRGPDGRLRGWSEFDPPAPLNVYGRAKAAGEQLVRQTLPQHHIVRTAWLAGARGGNFVRTVLRLADERSELEVVDDEVGSPTFTRDLAVALRELAVSGRYGTHHRVNAGSCSRHELAVATLELAGRTTPVHAVTRDRLRRAAPRPSYAVLDDRHTVLAGARPLPHWREGLTRLLRELDELDELDGQGGPGGRGGGR
jgi:dTDP-4-dehydrorhamnose reductase